MKSANGSGYDAKVFGNQSVQESSSQVGLAHVFVIANMKLFICLMTLEPYEVTSSK